MKAATWQQNQAVPHQPCWEAFPELLEQPAVQWERAATSCQSDIHDVPEMQTAVLARVEASAQRRARCSSEKRWGWL